MGTNTNPQEFAILYEKVYKDMYRFALYTLGHTQDAEDVVSETVMDAYKGFPRLRNKDAFRPWIFKILQRKCKRKLKEYLHKTTPLTWEIPLESSMEEDLQVRQAFSQLSSQERLIVSLHIFGGYNSRETGKLLHLNDNTVRSKESRALEKMRNWLSSEKEVAR